MHVINSLFMLQFLTTYVLDSDSTVYSTSEGITVMEEISSCWEDSKS